ncbi:MAG: cell division protein FtsA [Tannerellaceae bacterium]|jgi:cell division protein FtsA|nr:cell division protein FtsA [Tannerellaceae bacterium]
MAHADFIAAIYLGTSRITGIVGKKEAGVITVIAYETEKSAGCIRRGRVYNIQETSAKVKAIVRRMESKIPGSRIGKLYVGVGGQSIRSEEHTVSRSLDADRMVTDELIDSLFDEIRTCRPEGLDVLSVIPSAYFLDESERPEFDPVGVSCSLIKAKYQLIVANPSIRKRIVKCIAEEAKIEIAGILPSPPVLADVVLSENDKNQGCALIDFGAGVTSLAIYKNGRLLSLCVIPLGGNLITKDLADCLGIKEADAERLKRDYGNALVDNNDTSTLKVDVEEVEEFSVSLAKFNTILGARLQEILENVYKKLTAVELAGLRAGIVITGGAANLENLPAVIHNRLKTEVRYAFIREDLNVKGKQSDLAPDGITLGLLLKGETPCVEQTIPKPAPPVIPAPPVVSKQQPVDPPPPEPDVVKNDPKPDPEPQKPKKKGKGIGDKFNIFVGDLFKEQ